MYRRQFLITIASASGALALGCAPARRGTTAGPPLTPSAFLRIDPDGAVTVTVARAEMGQGSRTALALLVAEELDADWSRVRVEQGDLDPRYGDQFAGGSAVVRTSWEPLRGAGAAARAMLVSAAAARWGVPVAECRTENGEVRHAAKGRLGYGELVGEARLLPVPAKPELKTPQAFRLIGKGRPNVDHPAIVTGAIAFGTDTRVPGMLYAVIARAPVFGARVAKLDDAKARAMPGVRDVVVLDADALPDFGENNPKPANGVAVIATSTWAALQAREALSIEWDERGGRDEGTAVMRARAEALAKRKDRFVTMVGTDVGAALARSAHRLEAVYETPLLAHAQMEPMNCTASVTGARCEVWAPTQNPEYVRTIGHLVTGLAPGQITVHVTRMGGAFGRRFYADYAAEAILVSKAARAPVQVMWTREDDLGHGFYRPAGYHLLRGGLDGAGKITAWEHRLFSASRGHYLKWQAPKGKELNPGELSRDDYPAVLAPAFRFGYTPIDSKIPRGQWRAVENSGNVFVTQSFQDELAHAAGADPLAFRLALLEATAGPPPSRGAYDAARLRRVLRLAAEKAGWDHPFGTGRGRGIAGCFANQSYVAHVVEVTLTGPTRVRVDRVVAVVDCGVVVNPSGARAQIEGSVLQGLSTAFREQITVSNGQVDQRNFDTYALLRFREAPPIEVYFIDGPGNLGGLGEPGLPPAAPALTNAIFAASGTRLRRLPISLDGFHAA